MMKNKVRVLCVVMAVLAVGLVSYRILQYLACQLAYQAIQTDAHDIGHAMDRIACQQTALFVIEHMPKVPVLPNKFALLDLSLRASGASPNGLYCEFGVYTGTTINYIASKTASTIHGFDSFEGLPETWRTDYGTGTFGLSGLPQVRENVKLYKGWFNESLPIWAKEHPGPIAFMHLDADLYSSTKTVFDVLGDRIGPGTVLQFDEYFNYPGWQQGEFKAFQEFVESRHVAFEYLGYAEQQVAVRIVRVGPPEQP